VLVFKKIKHYLGQLKQDVLVLWFAIRSPNTPTIPKILAFLAVAYAFSPIDLIPDFIPILGYVDDVILIPIMVFLILKMIPNSVLQTARVEANEWLIQNKAKPTNRYGLIIIFFIWFLIGWLLFEYLKA
jgi:uncharacterized membrane protein YkvA (DUF1232 family)